MEILLKVGKQFGTSDNNCAPRMPKAIYKRKKIKKRKKKLKWKLHRRSQNKPHSFWSQSTAPRHKSTNNSSSGDCASPAVCGGLQVRQHERVKVVRASTQTILRARCGDFRFKIDYTSYECWIRIHAYVRC